MTKGYRAILTLMTLAAVLAGCPSGSRQPALRSAKITPPVLKPGDSALITAEVKDNYSIVDRVVVMANVEQNVTFDLHDDGADGDVAAKDGVWSFWVEVPFNAPPGEYHFTMTAYSPDGNVILTRADRGETAPLTATFVCTIEGPETPEAPAPVQMP